MLRVDNKISSNNMIQKRITPNARSFNDITIRSKRKINENLLQIYIYVKFILTPKCITLNNTNGINLEFRAS